MLIPRAGYIPTGALLSSAPTSRILTSRTRIPSGISQARIIERAPSSLISKYSRLTPTAITGAARPLAIPITGGIVPGTPTARGAIPQQPAVIPAGGGIALGGITSSITGAGSSVMNTIGTYIPLAIKIILAVIVLKIVFWLLRGGRR